MTGTRTSLNLIIAFALLAPAMILCGCNQTPEEIVVYDIPKKESDLDNLREPPPFLQQMLNSGAAAGAQKVDARIVVAVADRNGTVWYFKILGPVEQVNEAEPVWREFLSSVEFVNESPEWKLPEEWLVEDDSRGRFATIRMNNETPPLEMAVTSFEMSFAPLMNINRWRGQVSLAGIAEMPGPMPTVSARGCELLLFDELGKTAVAGGASPPMTGLPADGASEVPSVEADEIDAPEEIKFAAPVGWEEEPSSMAFIRARFVKQDDAKEVKITVSAMSLHNTWSDVVGQWSGQSGIEPLKLEEASDRISEITVGSTPGKLIRIVEPGDEVTSAVIGAMVTRGQLNWFFKLHGDKRLVDENEELFKGFLESFEFVDAE